MSHITKKDVEHVAGLARINLSEKQKDQLAEDLGAILTYVDKLKEVDTKGIHTTVHTVGLENVFRKDEITERLPAEKIKRLIDQAPDSKDSYVKVKSVFED